MAAAPARAYPRTLIIDTDAGIDDAQALVCALRYAQEHPSEVRIGAITCSHGNSTLPQVVGNVCAVLHAVAQHTGTPLDIPVFVGAAEPLTAGRMATHSTVWHGDDGLGNTGLGLSSPRDTVRNDMGAPAAMARIARDAAEAGEQVDIVTLGPLTNLALAVRTYPRLASDVHAVFVMGGAHSARGNATLAAEFNIHEDPEAAEIVFGTFGEVHMISWELTLKYPLPESFLTEWFRHDTSLGKFLAVVSKHMVDATESTGSGPFVIPDPLAMVVALRPDMITKMSRHAVFVETAGIYTRGMTVVDWSDAAPAAISAPGRVVVRGKAVIVEEVDEEMVRRTLLESVSK